MNNRIDNHSATLSRPVRGRLLTLLLVGLAVSPAQAWDLHFTTLYEDHYEQLPVNGSKPIQVCMDAEMMAYVKSKIWPGAPVQVTFRWIPQTDPGQQGVAYAPWQGQAASLPLQATLSGPLADGRYCSYTTVAWKDFPAAGDWRVWADMPKQFSLGSATGLIRVVPSPVKAGKPGPLNAVPSQSVLPPAKAGDKAKERFRMPLQPAAAARTAPAPSLPMPGAQAISQTSPALPAVQHPQAGGFANPRLNPQPEVPSTRAGVGRVSPALPAVQQPAGGTTDPRAINPQPEPPGIVHGRPPVKPTLPAVRQPAGATLATPQTGTPASQVQNAPGAPDTPRGGM
ncbi:MAG: hypothetical protein P8178_17060 [Candidatus Thiodiazotropha sp.]